MPARNVFEWPLATCRYKGRVSGDESGSYLLPRARQIMSGEDNVNPQDMAGVYIVICGRPLTTGRG